MEFIDLQAQYIALKEEIDAGIFEVLNEKENEIEPLEKLKAMMSESGISESDIQSVVARKGTYKADIPIVDYDPGFIKTSLIPNWDKITEIIKKN